MKTVISTAVGGLIALCAGWAGSIWSRHRDERAAISALITDLSVRRAFTFTPETELPWDAVEDERGPYALATKSVLEVRELLRALIGRVKPGSARAVALLSGFQECNAYLETSDSNRPYYAQPLNVLTARLTDMVESLQATDPKRIVDYSPGANAYPSAS